MSSDENATLAIWHSLWVNLKHTIHIKRQDTPRGVDTQGHNSQAHPGGAQQRDETAHHPAHHALRNEDVKGVDRLRELGNGRT